MAILYKKKRLQSGLFGRYFNTYFSDNMGNLTTATNSEVRTQLSSFSVGTTDTWLFRGYFRADTTSTTWQFRTNSDDASFVWIGSDSTAIDTSLDTDNAVVDNGGLHGAQTRTSNDKFALAMHECIGAQVCRPTSLAAPRTAHVRGP